MEALWIVIAIAVGFFFGYKFCMLRWRPKLLLKLSRLQSKLMSGEVGGEEAIKELRILEKQYDL